MNGCAFKAIAALTRLLDLQHLIGCDALERLYGSRGPANFDFVGDARFAQAEVNGHGA
jgi:hypothetical protein